MTVSISTNVMPSREHLARPVVCLVIAVPFRQEEPLPDSPLSGKASVECTF